MIETQPSKPSSPADEPTRDVHAPPRSVGWLEERLQLTALQEKYGRKAFPVHSTFFLGEMAAISVGILVVTGIYLGQIWLLVRSVPLLVGATMFGWSRLSHPTGAVARFDPTSED